MIEIFKNWITSMLCLGIFTTFIQLILPKTNLKKYIYSLVGIITIITVISPFINILKNPNVEEGVSQVLANITKNDNVSNIDSQKYKNDSESAVKEGFIDGVKNDIKLKLASKGVSVKNVDISVNENYDISKIEVYVKKLNKNTSTIASVNKVVEYINTEYDIEFSKITVIEEGE